MIKIDVPLAPEFERQAWAMYMDQVRRIQPLSPEQERAVLRRVANGEEIARKELAAANLHMVVRIVQKYKRNGAPQLELIQEGNIGLMRAIERFSPAIKKPFSTYASGMITRSIRAALKKRS